MTLKFLLFAKRLIGSTEQARENASVSLKTVKSKILKPGLQFGGLFLKNALFFTAVVMGSKNAVFTFLNFAIF